MIKLKNILNTDSLLKYMLVIFFTYDFMTKLLVHYFDLVNFYNYAIVFKTLITLIVALHLGLNYIKKSVFIVILLLSFSFLVGFSSMFSFMTRADVLFNGYYFLSSVVPICFLLLFFYYDKYSVLEFIVNGFLIFMAINGVAVLLGLIFDLEIFKTYWRSGGRYGYQGFLIYHSEAGYLFFIAINMAYYKYKKAKVLTNKLIFVLIFLSSLVVGTKKALLLSLIFLIYFLIDNRKAIISKQALKIIAPLFIIAIFFKNQISSVFLKQYYLFYEIYKDRGLLTSFLSYRDVLFKDKFIPYVNEQWSFINYIFGGPAFSRYRVELELFDVILFFGIVGLVSYFFLFKIILEKRNKLIYFMSFMMIFASLFSGNLLSRINILIVFFICINYITLNQNIENK